jgi:hypothetical protein
MSDRTTSFDLSEHEVTVTITAPSERVAMIANIMAPGLMGEHTRYWMDDDILVLPDHYIAIKCDSVTVWETPTCRNCDAPTTGTYCSTVCEDMDAHPAPRDDMERFTR